MKNERPHKKLLVWKESMQLVKSIYKLTEKLPESEKFGITSQIRRATVSVPVNIAEGAARNTKKEFLQFLYISSGSLSEVDTLIEISFDLEFIKETEYNSIIEKTAKISAMLNGLRKSIKAQIKGASK